LEEIEMNRTIMRPLAFAVAVLITGLALTAGRAAAPLKSDSVVKATAVAGKPDADGKQTVTLTLAIDKGWHLYANPVGQEDLASVQTTVKVKAKDALENVKVDYPAGKKIKDTVIGDYVVYEDAATIKISVNRAKGDDSPLELTVKLQACSDSTCLQPGEVKLTAAP
jgi:DsbC/DsbD-like thiol-disulfide interchange protein